MQQLNDGSATDRRRPPMRPNETALRIAVVAVALTLAAACGGGDRGGGAPATTDQATSERSSTVVADEAALRGALDLFLAQVNGPGGVVAVSVAGSDPVIVARGVSDLRTGAPMPQDPVFHLAYLTDTFVNAVALQLFDEGLIDLDDRVADYLPDAPHADELTIRNLLEHTSGFPTWWGSEETQRSLIEQILADPTHRYTTDEVLAIAGEQTMAFATGADAKVSAQNTLLTRLIVEQVTGNDFGHEVRSRILDPLGLDDTTYGADSRRPDELLGGLRWQDYDLGKPWTAEPDLQAWTTLMESPGWMASSVSDLVRWGNALYRTDDVVPASVAERAREINEFGSAPIGIVVTAEKGVCAMLAECDDEDLDYVGFGQPSLASGTYAGLFYDWDIDTVTVVVTNLSASIRPLYAAVRSTLGAA
jgi:D-alanyl-D-alanine carboxypeptidase